jgi:hypothetical protein
MELIFNVDYLGVYVYNCKNSWSNTICSPHLSAYFTAVLVFGYSVSSLLK